MEIAKPRCGSISEHDAHEFFPPRWPGEAVHCHGLSARGAATIELIELLLGVPREYGTWKADGGWEPPPGLVLQAHPVVRYSLLNAIIPGYTEFVSQQEPKPGNVPLMVTPAAERGSWKLVSDAGELASGRLPD